MTPGDVMPDFVFTLADGTKARFYGKAGGEPGLVCFGETADLRGKMEIDLYEIKDDRLRNSLGADVILFGADLRVIASWVDNKNWITEARDLVEKIEKPMAREVFSQAPVLLLPNVLEDDFCDRLIAIWEKDNDETGVEYEATRETGIVESIKRRSDHTLADGPVMRELTQRIGRRLIPSVEKAFGYRASRFEGFKIGAYDAASRGFFRRHRDNLSPKTAHRKFAITLNLNQGYEGGHLQFAEYGPQLYRPAKGGAIVFSASLLHEALEVTSGRRFVLISFLFD